MKNIIRHNKQKGIALPIALFALFAILLATAALIRSGEFSSTIAGDIGHREMVAQSNDEVAAFAITWLKNNSENLNNTQGSQGYYSSYPATWPDFTKDNAWASSKAVAANSLGISGNYVIYRMCKQPNVAFNGATGGISNECAVAVAIPQSGNTGNSAGYGSFEFEGNPSVFFKVIVRSIGPKGATSVSETILSINQ